MTEADILAQFQASRYNLSVISGQILGLTFALIVAAYYFLHRAGIGLKLIAFLLFTAGYASMLFLFALENIHLDGLEFALSEIVKGDDASVVSQRLYDGWALGRTPIPDLLIGFLLIAGWASVGFLIFFYKFDERKEAPAKPEEDTTESHEA